MEFLTTSSTIGICFDESVPFFFFFLHSVQAQEDTCRDASRDCLVPANSRDYKLTTWNNAGSFFQKELALQTFC